MNMSSASFTYCYLEPSFRACVVVDDRLYVIGGQEGDFMAKPGSPIFKCSRREEVSHGQNTYFSLKICLGFILVNPGLPLLNISLMSQRFCVWKGGILLLRKRL